VPHGDVWCGPAGEGRHPVTRLLRSRWVLAFQDGDHRLLTEGEVLVEGRRVVGVGPRGTLGSADEVVELGDALLLPGLIDLDALADIDHAILDSWQTDAGSVRLQWSKRHARGARTPVLTAEQRATMRRFAFAELLLHGITTAMPIASEVHSDWAETYDDALVMAAEAERLGLRVFLGPSFRSGVPVASDGTGVEVVWDLERGETGLADAVRFVEWSRAHASPLVTGVLLPCRIETLSDDLLSAIAAAAQRLDVPVRLHALQSLDELRLVADRGGTSLDLLERAGLLGPRLLLPHAIFVDEHPQVAPRGGGSVHRIAEAGATVIHCPLTSARYGHALHSFDGYLAAGVPMAMGTDSFPPDLLRGIDVGSSLAKIVSGRNDAGSHADYLRAATLGGASALGRPDLGRIAPGATADLVALRLDDVRDGVVDDPVRTVVNHSTARAVDLVMTEGKVRVRGGELVGLNMSELRRRAQELFVLLREGYVGRASGPVTVAELFPPSFPGFVP
jgi:8-oxoguanine deaminase